MWQSTVQTWLTNSPALSNLQLHPISNRFNDEFIVSFLADSELPAAGMIAMQDPHGHHDLSDAPRSKGGRPRTRPLALGCEVGATGAAATALHAGAGAVTAAGGVSEAASTGDIRVSPTTAAGAASAAGAGARSPRGDEAGARAALLLPHLTRPRMNPPPAIPQRRPRLRPDVAAGEISLPIHA
jgi:hypothetical protein